MSKLVRVLAAIVLLTGLGAAVPTIDAMAAGGGGGGGGGGGAGGGGQAAVNSDFAKGERAIENGDWKLAIKYLEKSVQANPRDADGFNLLAYSHRRLGKLDAAFAHYATALRLDPEHRGAHEYVGEAYLMIGDLAKAEQHLSKITSICGGSCSEAKQLEKAIARFKDNEKQATLDEDW